jgi:hypothetical protein
MAASASPSATVNTWLRKSVSSSTVCPDWSSRSLSLVFSALSREIWTSRGSGISPASCAPCRHRPRPGRRSARGSPPRPRRCRASRSPPTGPGANHPTPPDQHRPHPPPTCHNTAPRSPHNPDNPRDTRMPTRPPTRGARHTDPGPRPQSHYEAPIRQPSLHWRHRLARSGPALR